MQLSIEKVYEKMELKLTRYAVSYKMKLHPAESGT